MWKVGECVSRSYCRRSKSFTCVLGNNWFSSIERPLCWRLSPLWIPLSHFGLGANIPERKQQQQLSFINSSLQWPLYTLQHTWIAAACTGLSIVGKQIRHVRESIQTWTLGWRVMAFSALCMTYLVTFMALGKSKVTKFGFESRWNF